MLHVDLPTESRGGVAHQVSHLSNALAERGSEVTIFTLSPPPSGARYHVEPLPVPAFARGRAARLVSIPLAFGLGRYGRFDVVHAHGDSQLLLRRRVPVVRTFYGSALDESRSAARLRRRVVQRAHHVGERIARRSAAYTVGISQATERSVGALDEIVPCGVDRKLLAPGEKSARPSILFVGTLGGRTRGAFLVDAFRRLIRPSVPEAELWLVTDEPIDEPGIRTWVRPDDEKLAELYRRAWIFASPSVYEGFGVPYIEALSSGTPVVAHVNPGALELLGTGTGGSVVGEDEFAETLLALLGDDERRLQLGATGREYSARFDWSEVASAYERIYEEVVRRGRAGSPA
jgi:glycosyltransferase involved in cell wall biosynthesis